MSGITSQEEFLQKIKEEVEKRKNPQLYLDMDGIRMHLRQKVWRKS